MTSSKRPQALGSRFRLILDYIFDGPPAIYPPPSRSSSRPWLENFITLEYMRPFRGPVEHLQIYELPNMLKGTGYSSKNYVYPIVRRVVWDRDRDEVRVQTRGVRWPSIDAKLYRVPANRFDELHAQILALDEVLPTFPFELRGIRRDSDPAPHGSIEPDPSVEYIINLRRGTQFTAVRLSSSSLARTDYTAAFIQLRDFLGSLCTPKSRVTAGWKERWTVTPRKYAAALDVAFPNGSGERKRS